MIIGEFLLNETSCIKLILLFASITIAPVQLSLIYRFDQVLHNITNQIFFIEFKSRIVTPGRQESEERPPAEGFATEIIIITN